jgi:hypothetical protein
MSYPFFSDSIILVVIGEASDVDNSITISISRSEILYLLFEKKAAFGKIIDSLFTGQRYLHIKNTKIKRKAKGYSKLT